MTNPTSLPIMLGRRSPEGPRYIPIVVLYPSVPSTPFTVDCSQGGISSLQSILIDNTLNSVPFNLYIGDTQQTISVPAYSSVISPLYTSNLVLNATIIAQTI